jgi:tetratricopeptide (TPR) repeat protein
VATNKDKHTLAAQKLVEKGQLDKAIGEYLKIVQQDDKDFRIWLKIGDLYAKLNKRQEAGAAYWKVAQYYSDQGFYLKAVAVYKQILKMEPKLIEVIQRLGELYKQLGLVSDAMQQFEALVVVHHKAGDVRRVIGALKEVVELDPEMVSNRIKLAELYSKEQMAREAVDEFGRAAQQLKDAGRVDDFVRVGERLLFHAPDNKLFCKELARIYTERGDPRRALPKLQVCFKANPRDLEVLGLLANAFAGLGQGQKAVSVLKEMARLQKESGDLEGRLETLRRVLELQPDDAEAAQEVRRPGLGHGAVHAEQPPSISTGLRAAIHEAGPQEDFNVPLVVTEAVEEQELAPPEAPAGGEAEPNTVVRLLNETDVYIKYKLYSKAIEHVQQVFAIEPGHVDALEKLKALYLTVGNVDEAKSVLWRLTEQAEPHRRRRFLHEILDLDPNDESARDALGASAAQVPQKEAETFEELPSDEFDMLEASGRVEVPPIPEADEDGVPLEIADVEEEVPADPFPVNEHTEMASAPPALGGIEDELDEADFFIQQSLFDEARQMLSSLLSRYPNHPLILAKLKDIESASEGQAEQLTGDDVVVDDEAQPPHEARGSSQPSVGKPVLELKVDRKVSSEDYETHYDLGIAYKEMGLIDDAIGEFKAVMKDPAREAQCLLMVGLCYNEKGQFTEAISHFKKALYVEAISDHETLSLYYELGQAYENLGDPREALYYFEKVVKRDPRFRNVERKLASLGGVDAQARPDVGGEDVEDVFESVFDEGASSK